MSEWGEEDSRRKRSGKHVASRKGASARKKRGDTASHAKEGIPEAAKPASRNPISRFHRWHKSLPRGRRILLWIVEIIVILAIVGVAFVYFFALRDLPECNDARAFNSNSATEVYASDGETLLARFQLECREPLDSLDEISPYVTMGTVAIEDERFYQHAGVDVQSIARALVNNVLGEPIQGASTITQQVVRNTILADEAFDINIRRKIREAYLALKMETMYSKDEILLMYLNVINYGQGAYGIESAAKRYFGVSASELTLAQSALLAGIPQSPTYNNPIDYPDHALARRNLVLGNMLSQGYITQEEYDAAIAEPLVLNETDLQYDGMYQYPYFCSYVRQQLLSSYDLTTEQLVTGGLKVVTTLDLDAQEAAEEAAEKKRSELGSDLDVAMVAVEPGTGYIKAMIGGSDYSESEWNLATQAKRQTGSSFKVFTLVAAIEDGIDPINTDVNCTSWVRVGTDSHLFHNIDNNNYGVQKIKGALAKSSNTGFVLLCQAVGPTKVAEVATRLGITSDLVQDVTVTLGSSSVTPLEMASAYATIASRGVKYDPTCIITVTDIYDTVIVDNTNPQGTQVITPEVADAARECMEAVVTEGTGIESKLSNGQPVAAKTGTSENYMDSWYVGFTPNLSVAIWGGDPDNETAIYSTVSTMFKNFMETYMGDSEITPFNEIETRPTYTRTFTNANLDLKNVETSSEVYERLEALMQETPQVVGMTQTAAVAALNAQAAASSSEYLSPITYTITIEEKESSIIKAGTVMTQQITGYYASYEGETAGTVNITLTVAKAVEKTDTKTNTGSSTGQTGNTGQTDSATQRQ